MVKKNTKKARRLVDSPDEWSFWVCDGRILRNIKDLIQALKQMTDEVFSYHVNKEKNDFAKWVEEVLQDKDLAQGIKKTKTRYAALKKVEAELKKYC